MIIPDIHLIFDLIFDLILFDFTFNFHIGTTPMLANARPDAERLAARLADAEERATAPAQVLVSRVRRRMNNELDFPPNFERLVLGCIDADFCK